MLSEKLVAVSLFAADVTKALVQPEPLEPHFHAHLERLLAQLGLRQPAAKEEEAPPPPPPPPAAAADAPVPTDIPTKPTPVKPRRTTRHSVAARAMTPPAPSPKASGRRRWSP